MNTYNINDSNFINSKVYKDYLSENPESGRLRIRAYAASGAIPISGVKIVISKLIDNNIVIFYDGITDSSGLIEKVVLPAPKLDISNLGVPKKATYDVKATYNDIDRLFKVNIYENICVVQNINITPDMSAGGMI